MTGMRDDDPLLRTVREVFDERIPFNRVLGLRIHDLDPERPTLRFHMHEDLIGNFVRRTLHGGVISSVIDVTGGLAAFLGAIGKISDLPLETKLDRFGRLGTIDLRVDYLRPGHGEWFESTGFVLRTGNKVAVTRIELKNDRDVLIAVGTGAYVVA